MSQLAIIGGSGLNQLTGFEVEREQRITTPYGETSAPMRYGNLLGLPVFFLPRHGDGHTLPPHRINYRANIWALKRLNVTDIIAVAAVGGIHEEFEPGTLALPDQLIDYTHGRESTFFDGEDGTVEHVDFSYPYDERLRLALFNAAQQADIACLSHGTYGATQGPRLETAAEIQRMKQDGCDMVGMTGMPEAILAREAGLTYACCAVSANWAAGLGNSMEISMDEIHQNLESGMLHVQKLLMSTLASYR